MPSTNAMTRSMASSIRGFGWSRIRRRRAPPGAAGEPETVGGFPSLAAGGGGGGGGRTAVDRGRPQPPQNCALSRFARPHAAHSVTERGPAVAGPFHAVLSREGRPSLMPVAMYSPPAPLPRVPPRI